MADGARPAELTPDQAAATMASRGFVVLLVLVAIVGVIVSFATWAFLELIYQITRELYTHLPNALGYQHGPPVWWPLPILGIAGVIVALAITRLRGNGGHIPAKGLAAGKPTTPDELPGILLAGLVGISFGIVLGPEAAAGIGSLLAIGMGSWTGLNRSAISLGQLQVPHFGDPTIAQFGWTIALALAVALIAQLIFRGGLLTYRFSAPRPLLLLPLVGLIVAGLAIAFSQAADKSVNEVLFSGESGLSGLVAQAGGWSLSALALLIVFKGLAYGLSLGSFRGGPTFPAVFLGAAGGLMASHLPGFAVTPAVAVGMGAAVASVLRLPLTGVVLATFLTVSGGTGDEPLIIVGVVAAYRATLLISRARTGEGTSDPDGAASPASYNGGVARTRGDAAALGSASG